MMNNKVEELQTRMIRIYGFEHECTIAFFTFCETCNDITILETIVKAHEEFPQILSLDK